jgi:hypothetical protein
MKKFIRLMAFFVAVSSILVIQSCDDEDPPIPPTLTGPASVASVQIGAKADVTFTFRADEGFRTATASATGGTATIKTNGTDGATEGNIVVEFTADNTPGAAVVTVTVTDARDQVVTATGTLNKTISAPPSVALSSATAQGFAGGTVTVTATVTAANGARNITYTTTGGLTGTPASPVTLTGTTATQQFTFTLPASAAVGAVLTAVFTAQDNQNLNSTPVTFTVTSTTNELTGTQAANLTIVKGQPYLVKGTYIIPSGVTVTVQPGAIVKGDKATKGLILVQPGGRLVANGTAAEPIVFTSSQNVGERDRGDWAGIVMLGNAFVNQTARPAIEGVTPEQRYGSVAPDANPSTNASDNSGTLRYVRIEYAGIELTPNNETNSLTMGGLGNGTVMEYVQVSFGGDDGFEWFGGTVNGKWLVSHSTWDDDFDTDFGWGGNVQFGLVVRNPFFADQSGSNAFESDNQANGNPINGICDGTTNTGCTRGVFSNITVLGPRDIQSRGISGNYQNAIHIRRRTAMSLFNSFISGYRIGVRLDDQGTLDNLTSGAGKHANNVLAVPGTTLIGTSTTAADAAFATGLTIAPDPAGNATAISNYWTTNGNAAINNITAITPLTDLGVANNYWATSTAATYPSNPNFAITAGVAGNNNLNAGAAFTDAKLTAAGTFFTTVTYRGAFGATDWTDGWAEFQPINRNY